MCCVVQVRATAAELLDALEVASGRRFDDRELETGVEAATTEERRGEGGYGVGRVNKKGCGELSGLAGSAGWGQARAGRSAGTDLAPASASTAIVEVWLLAAAQKTAVQPSATLTWSLLTRPWPQRNRTTASCWFAAAHMRAV